MLIPLDDVKGRLKAILLELDFTEQKAEVCSQIFMENSRDGVHSHGLNRFPVFVKAVRDGLVIKEAEPECLASIGNLEQWDGHLAPGMYTATLCMKRAIELARQSGIGAVAVKNTNHWMRGGTYGWQAADENCIAICATNAIANMPPYGGIEPTLGNNPLVIAVPRSSGHVVLDMAMSQYSYGKLQEYSLADKKLPVTGGYDEEGRLSHDPLAITKSKRTLPIGFWKGSGLSMLLDMLVTSLSGGRSVADITKDGREHSVSQFFLCIDAATLQSAAIEEIIAFTAQSPAVDAKSKIYYPGEQTLATRRKSQKEGIRVNEEVWQTVMAL